MPIRALSLLALLASATAAAEEAWSGPGHHGVLHEGRAFVLEAGFRHVRAVPLVEGTTGWRRRIQSDEPRGHHALAVVADQLYLHGGPSLYRIEPSNGRVLVQVQTVHRQPRCHLEGRQDALAVECEQGLWLLDPGTLGTLAFFPQPASHIYSEGLGRPHDVVYPWQWPRLIGRGGEVVVVAIAHPRRGAGLAEPDTLLLGVDAADGSERWRAEVAPRGLDERGVSADGRTAWVADFRERQVVALDVGSGELRWTARGGEGPFSAMATKDGAALVVLADGEASLRDLRSGEVGWRVPSGGAELAIPAGTGPKVARWPHREPLPFVVVDGQGGLAPGEVPMGGHLAPDPLGGGVAVLRDGHLELRGPQGEVVAGQSLPAGAPELRGNAVILRSSEALTVVTRGGAAVGTFPPRTVLLGADASHVLLLEPGEAPEEPGTLRVIKLPEGG